MNYYYPNIGDAVGNAKGGSVGWTIGAVGSKVRETVGGVVGAVGKNPFANTLKIFGCEK